MQCKGGWRIRWSAYASAGMDEALPVEQVKANKEQQRHDVRRNKLLERLIDAVRREQA